MGIAKLRGFKYPNSSWQPGTRPYVRPERTLSTVLAEFGEAVDAKKQKRDDQLARQSAAHHAKVIADRDLPPDPAEVQVVEKAGQKCWQF